MSSYALYTTGQIAAMQTTTVASLTDSDIRALSTSQFAIFSGASATLGVVDTGSGTAQAVAGQLAALSTLAASAILPDQIAVLTTDQLIAI